MCAALQRSPFGTSGCHGARSILPTGVPLLRRRVEECVTVFGGAGYRRDGDVRPWESSAFSLLKVKTQLELNLAPSAQMDGERRVGEEARHPVCRIFPLFRWWWWWGGLFHNVSGGNGVTPVGAVRNAGNAAKLCRMEGKKVRVRDCCMLGDLDRQCERV